MTVPGDDMAAVALHLTVGMYVWHCGSRAFHYQDTVEGLKNQAVSCLQCWNVCFCKRLKPWPSTSKFFFYTCAFDRAQWYGSDWIQKLVWNDNETVIDAPTVTELQGWTQLRVSREQGKKSSNALDTSMIDRPYSGLRNADLSLCVAENRHGRPVKFKR